MSRNVKALSLVLKTNPVGEHHRGLSMLVSGEGLIRPLAFGAQARRSHLRASAVPFNIGMANLHFDGSKNQWKLIAFDVSDTHDAVREDWSRFVTASIWAEVLIKTAGGGGDSIDQYEQTTRALGLLCRAAPVDARRLNIGYLWHFLATEGVQPDPLQCEGDMLPDKAIAWLVHISGDLESCLNIDLDTKTLAIIEKWIFDLLQSFVGSRLKSVAFAVSDAI